MQGKVSIIIIVIIIIIIIIVIIIIINIISADEIQYKEVAKESSYNKVEVLPPPDSLESNNSTARQTFTHFPRVKYLLKQMVDMKNEDWDDLDWDSAARAFTIQIS